MRKIVLAAALMSAAAVVAAPASAEPLLYTYTMPSGYLATWSIDSNPTPTGFDSTGFSLDIFDYVSPNTTSNNVSMTFYDASQVPFNFYDPGSGFASGDNLYSGPTSSPTMNTGVFSIVSDNYGPGSLSVVGSGGPGAPGPLAGVGLLPALAGAGALFGTRFRRRKPVAA
jgi:hypothetical protein